MVGHLRALIPSDGGVHGPGQGVDHALEGIGDGGRVVAGAQAADEHEPAGAFHQGDQGAAGVASDDRVCLPVPGNGPVVAPGGGRILMVAPWIQLLPLGGVRGWLHHYGFGGVVDVPCGVRVADEVRLRAMELIADGRSASAAARELGVSHTTVQRWARGAGVGLAMGAVGARRPGGRPAQAGGVRGLGGRGRAGRGRPGRGRVRSRPRAGGCTIRV